MCPGINAGKLCSFTCFSYHQLALPIHTFSSTFNSLRPWFYVKMPSTRNEHHGVLVLSRYQEPLTQNGAILDPLKIQKSNGFSSIVYVPNNLIVTFTDCVTSKTPLVEYTLHRAMQWQTQDSILFSIYFFPKEILTEKINK